MSVERQLRRKNRKSEVTAELIYANLANHFNWTDKQAEEALSVEIECEIKGWRLVPAICEQIHHIHNSNGNVIYISDMYLPKNAIQNYLKEEDVWKKGDVLYVSSSSGLRKSTGELFNFCLNDLNIQPHQLYHHGDNLISDVNSAKKKGINTFYFSDTKLTRYEKKISDELSIPLTLRSLLAGSCKLNRLNFKKTVSSSHLETIWHTASDVMGPVLFGFVHWCLVEAKNKGISRLYFIARDGQILHRIATVICEKWNYPIDCRYLYGSRQAIKFPNISTLGVNELAWIFKLDEGPITVISICERACISSNQIKNELIANGFPKSTWETHLSRTEANRLKEVFQSEKNISDLIISTARKYRDVAIGYFRQEGLFDDVTYGIVDLGWKGGMLKAINDLVCIQDPQRSENIPGFYFGLKRRPSLSSDLLTAYYYDHLAPNTKRFMICKCSELFEALVAADHGSTIKYGETDGKFYPVLRNIENSELIEWGIHNYQEAIISFSEIFVSVVNKETFTSKHSLAISDLLLSMFVQKPSKSEATVFGKIQHSQDMVESGLFYLAPKLTSRDFLSLSLTGKPFPNYYWFHAVFAQDDRLSTKIFLPLFQLHQFIRTLIHKLFHV